MSETSGSGVTVADVKALPLKTFDAIGTLVFMENHQPVPFKIERVFAVSGVPAGSTRGDHAHKACGQALVCLQGVCTVLCDDGREKKTFRLDGPGCLLYVPPMIWASETYEVPHTVLMVLADQRYDPADYIREYDEYLKLRAVR
jgi:UDP-2-acetamido-3-amino-2,3-dideoxy-glucuronate N-acetyltransferase